MSPSLKHVRDFNNYFKYSIRTFIFNSIRCELSNIRWVGSRHSQCCHNRKKGTKLQWDIEYVNIVILKISPFKIGQKQQQCQDNFSTSIQYLSNILDVSKKQNISIVFVTIDLKFCYIKCFYVVTRSCMYLSITSGSLCHYA